MMPRVSALLTRLNYSECLARDMMPLSSWSRQTARRTAMQVVELSRAARDVVSRRAAGEDVDVTAESLEAYRESEALARLPFRGRSPR
jgi:hypothetical protein